MSSAVALAVALAGRGGGSDSLSAARYRSKLRDACTIANRATGRLPELQRDEHLTIAQLRRRAGEIDRRFSSTVSSLRPPASLQADQHRLLVLGRGRQPSDPTRAQALAASERVRAVYLQIGVPGCVKPLDRAIVQLRTS